MKKLSGQKNSINESACDYGRNLGPSLRPSIKEQSVEWENSEPKKFHAQKSTGFNFQGQIHLIIFETG